MQKNILITGCDGMLGSEALALFAKWGYNVIKANKDNCDVTDLSKVKNFFKDKKLDYVFHAAAYTKVDAAESNRDIAFLVNSKGAENIAIAAKEAGASVIFISTDYVFDGKKNQPYLVGDKTNPISIYGASKLAGEECVKKENLQHYIVRTSWLYGKNGKNFVDTMINLSKSKKEIKVVSNQFGCPTSTTDLILAIKTLIEQKSNFGIYHLCGSGVTSWFEFAKKIFEILKIEIDVVPVSSAEFAAAATRPEFSAMDNGNLLKNWEEALKDYLISA